MGTSISAGITPACAGKSFFTGLEHLSDGDHPRMRGEKFSPNPEAYKTKGSPPHARGKAGKLHRIYIPARDHPRMRGEKRWWQKSLVRCRGSPPHARGKDLESIEI